MSLEGKSKSFSKKNECQLWLLIAELINGHSIKHTIYVKPTFAQDAITTITLA